MEYYESKLNQDEHKFYLKLIDAIRNVKPTAKANNITDEESFMRCINAIKWDYPEFFYLDIFDFSYIPYTDGWEYQIKYLYTREEVIRKKQEIDAVISRILKNMEDLHITSVYQKCGYIHGYLVTNCTYNNEAIEPDKHIPDAYTIEGPLLRKTGVCQGLRLLFGQYVKDVMLKQSMRRGFLYVPDVKNMKGMDGISFWPVTVLHR